MFRIYVNNKQEKVKLDEFEIENIVNDIFDAGELDKVGEVSFTFVDDDEMQELNKQYRGIDKTTDVLSFPQEEGMEMPHQEDDDYIPLIGDVIISAPTAKLQAEKMGHELDKEIKVLLIHGILHLYGYDHDNVYQQSFMQDEEKTILLALDKVKTEIG